jgi:hypothetical protein
MASTTGKLRLVLKSTKVLVRIEDYQTNSGPSGSLTAWNGQLFATRRRVMVYDYVYDERQALALREARELATKTGLVLEVTDLSRRGALRRILRFGT